ncbi:MAG: tetratricopeptide repeat protein, partial [Bacteroidota bacterium]|nr:tetratricopeptide repeat protein [Bacteroidota bacterium]
IKQHKIQEALPLVKKSLKLTNKKEQEIRLLFILAQINEELNNKIKASDYYSAVIKKNPPYEMTFNAKIKLASLYAGDNGKDIKKQLQDMLEDEKNTDYLDQIYYALGEIAINNNEEKIALNNYKLSAINSISNDNQKGLAYLAVADIYFKNKKYTPAQLYYDSTVNSLEPTYPGYSELLRKNNNLSKLVVNVQQAELQDSVQRIAKMSKKERNALIDNIIAKVKEKEKQEREEKTSGNTSRFTQSSNRYQTNYGDNGKWYFYSQNAKSFGEPDFQRRWGKRKLEDNWRRKNKRDLSVINLDETETTKTEIDNKTGLSNKSRDYYIVDIPLNDSSLQASNKKLEKALFKVGEVYMNNLKNNEEAIKAFLALDKRYPKGKYKLPSYYYLYNLYNESNKNSLANKYKNYIVKNYPNSKYTMVLTNPDFFKELEKKEKEKENYYNNTYDLYKQNNYSNVITNCSIAKEKYKDTKLLSKFYFLNALASGKLYGIKELKIKLNEVSDKYAKTDVGIRAKELIESIEKNELNPIIAQQTITKQVNTQDTVENQIKTNTTKPQKNKKSIYSKPQDKDKYYFVLLIDKNVDVNMLKFKLINFNIDYFLQKDYTTENKLFNKYFEIITVKTIDKTDIAKEYYEIFNATEDKILKDFKDVNYQYFIISIDNYVSLIKEKSVRDYLLFFKNNFSYK